MSAPAQMIGLFEGYGGLSMAVTDVTGAELVAYSELDPAASKLLAHHNPGVPNLGDITKIDWSAVHVAAGRPLILTGGFPCQDVSAAGRRAGLRPGTRSGLWSHMAYAVDQLRPDLAVIENVRGLLSADAACDLEPCPWCVGDDEGRPLRALGAVLGDLADIGYDASWVGLRAADVGAPHGRFRVFVLAWPAADTDGDAVREQPVAEPGRGGTAEPRHARRDAAANTDGSGREWAAALAGALGAAEGAPSAIVGAGGRSRPAADASSDGRDEGRTEPARVVGRSDAAVGRDGAAPDTDRVGPVRSRDARRGRAGSADDDRVAADADGAGSQGLERGAHGSAGPTALGDSAPPAAPIAWGDYGPAIRRWELILGRPAPAPTQTGAKGGRQLSPLFVEWLMGLPEGWVTDPAIGLTRNEQLARLGNGVVPQQAAAALRWLLAAADAGRAAA